jgi:hypothetical protein
VPTELPANSQVRFNAQALVDRAQIAAAMMKVISLCSEMDYRWAIILAEILEAEAAAGVAMFNAVENQNARGRLLLAAAEKRLDAHHRQRLKKLLDRAIKAVAVRNSIAHGQWGGLEGDLDGIVLGDGRWASTSVARLLACQHGVETILGSATSEMQMQRYTAADFDAEAAKLTAIIRQQMDLSEAFKSYRSVIRGLVMAGATRLPRDGTIASSESE